MQRRGLQASPAGAWAYTTHIVHPPEASVAITRKTFLIQLIGSGWVLSGCGGGGSSYSAPPAMSPAAGGCNASIADNHGHVLVVAAADLNSMVDMTYDIHGTADHTHSVTFTAAQLAQLKAGSMVTVTSTTTLAHSHVIGELCT
jgi:hypothetical protein